MKISVVIPVYGCPEALPNLYERLVKTLERITKSFEIILVNDGCPKNSWKQIEKICKQDNRIKGIKLSRNFGQHHATNCGIEYSKGDYVVLMDCDLQDKPEAIIDLYESINEGYDVVFSRRKDRKDSKLTLWLSRNFYNIYNYFTDSRYDFEVGNLSITNRKVVEEYKKISDKNKVFINYLSWMGFKTKTIDIDGGERFEGKSSYTFGKKINLAIEEITSQSNKPLKLLIKVGLCVALLGFVFLIVQIIRYFIYKNISEGWTSIIAVILLMGGIIVISLGGVGIYIGNIFNQIKGVPEYMVDEILNENKK